MTKKLSTLTLDAARIEEIKQQIAYRMWEDEGRPEGRSEAHWMAACDVVDEMLSNTAELPAWFRRVQQAEVQAEQQTDTEQHEPAPRFQEVARRFARGT